jgi:hypothetical protein
MLFRDPRVDRGHPGLGMRPDEIEGLTGVFKPNLIHEIRCPIRLERPGGYRKMLQQPNLELQLFVGFGKLPCSFRDSPIEFTCNPLLLIRRSACYNADHVRRIRKLLILLIYKQIRIARSPELSCPNIWS